MKRWLSVFTISVLLISSVYAELVIHKDYTLKYNEKYEQAEWVSYSITLDKIIGSVKRAGTFKIDPYISTVSASPLDYKGTKFDRGHLAPAAVFKHDPESMSSSFYMSNICPQYKEFNRGVWKKCEEYIRTLVFVYEKLYVVTGSVVIGEPNTIGENKVAVPHLLFNVVYDKNRKFLFAIVVPNRDITTSREVTDYFVPTQFIEALTGITSFENILRD